MDYESIKRLGLDHYNIDLEKSFESFDPSNNNHTIVLYLKKDKTISCPYYLLQFSRERIVKWELIRSEKVIFNENEMKIHLF